MLDSVYRAESGRILATLIRLLGDFDLAEEARQEAFTAALEQLASPQAVPFWALPLTIQRTERAGFSATGYRLQFHQLLATPVMFAGMSVLAAAFSLGLLRLGGLAALAGSGVGLGFLFFFMNQLCTSLGRAGVMPPMAAAWAPPALALLAGFTLLCYTEDG